MTTTPGSMPGSIDWLSLRRPNPSARLRLFCFHHAGGGASFFRQWTTGLSPDIEVCPVQLPGREGCFKERPFKRLSPLLEALTQILSPYLDKPFAFFGHSMGALVAFELSRHLRDESLQQPLHLIVSGRQAPHLPDQNPPIYRLSDVELIQKLREFNGIPQQVLREPELMQLFLPVLRADFETIETYRYSTGAPLNCGISAFGGLQDQTVDRDGLAAWREHTTGPFSVRMFPGDHFFLSDHGESFLRIVAEDLMSLMIP